MITNSNHKKTKKKVAFVIGSKPDAHFPEVVPDIIITANSAIKKVQDYYGKVEIVSIMSDQIFSNNVIPGEEGFIDDAQFYIKNSQMNKLVLLKTLSKSRYTIDFNEWLIFDNYVSLTRWGYHRLIFKFVSFKESFIHMIKKEKFNHIFKTIYQTIRYGKYNPTEVSTGILALAFALDRSLEYDIYVIGVGIDQNSGYEFSDNSKYNYFHIPRDIFFIKSLIKNGLINKIFFTDPNLINYIEIWKQENK